MARVKALLNGAGTGTANGDGVRRRRGDIGTVDDDGGGSSDNDALSTSTSTTTTTTTTTTITSASAAAVAAASAPTTTRRRRTTSSNSERPSLLNLSIPSLSLPKQLRKVLGLGGETTTTAAAAASSASSAARGGSKKTKNEGKNTLAHYDDLPDFLKDNDFVRSWYRPVSSPRAAVASLWRIHNETGNIWSHALGFALFALFALFFLRAAPTTLVPPPAALARLEARLLAAGHRHVRASHLADYFSSLAARAGEAAKHSAKELASVERALVNAAVRFEKRAVAALGEDARAAAHAADDAATAAAALLGARWPAPRWPALVFLAGAMTCLGTSAVCHLFGCCAQHVAAAVWRADYAGIVVLIVASFVPPVVYGFECHPFLQSFYLWSTVALGAATTCVTLLEFFQAPRFRTFRAILFTALGSWGFAPALHGLALYGRSEPAMRSAFAHYASMGALYVLGAATFAARVPERWAPGKFDVWGHSHQLFHVAIVAAAAVHWRGIRVLLAWREGVGGFCH